jgi:hypothetical protein
MTFAPFRRDPKQHWAGPLSVVVHVAAFVGIGLWLGWLNAVCIVALPALAMFGRGQLPLLRAAQLPRHRQSRIAASGTTPTPRCARSSMFDMRPAPSCTGSPATSATTTCTT